MKQHYEHQFTENSLNKQMCINLITKYFKGHFENYFNTYYNFNAMF